MVTSRCVLWDVRERPVERVAGVWWRGWRKCCDLGTGVTEDRWGHWRDTGRSGRVPVCRGAGGVQLKGAALRSRLALSALAAGREALWGGS